MKKYFYLTFAAAVLFAAGCGKGEFYPGPTLNITANPVITSPADASVIVLEESQADNPFVITWTPAEFGFQAAATYTVQIDRAGNDFANPIVLGNSTGTSLSSTVAKLNTALFTTLGLPGETPANIEMRLVVKISPEVPEIYSAPVALTISPYTIVIVYPFLHVPGSYQGWKPEDSTTVVYSAKSDSKYEGYIYFSADNTAFKYTDGPSWAVNYGDSGADGTLDAGGTDIFAGAAGLYRLNANLIDLTHKFELTKWGVIGSATAGGWDSDQDMSYDAANNKLTVTLDLVAGEIKFRANDDWAINMGDDSANTSLEYNGANIPIAEAGNYTIDLILSGAVYTYKVKKN
ncbi:MAG: SusE domain-containing protein [Saprospiraceae bacterium]|nr:SusE domain-containing protein [Saprospiraceae bacterium]